MRSLMDADLIEGVKVNNLAVFSEVYQQYYTKLYGYFFEKAQSQIISKELVQTTFIKFWNHRYRDFLLRLNQEKLDNYFDEREWEHYVPEFIHEEWTKQCYENN
ncbi:MAG: RNA polymerase sigma factor [Flavisolibacter sp.]